MDNPFAQAAGREIQGFAKCFAQFDFLQKIQEPEFAMKVTTFGDFDPHQKGRLEWLIKVQRSDKCPLRKETECWKSGKEASQAIIDLLLAHDDFRANFQIISYNPCSIRYFR